MWPARTMPMVRASQSWTKVALVRHWIGVRWVNHISRPVPSMTRVAPHDPGGVDLLARVELARGPRGPAFVAVQRGPQPDPVVRAEAVQEAEVGAEGAGGQAHQDRYRQRQTRPLVDADHQLTAADEFGELGDVETGRGRDADAHQGGCGPVDPLLTAAETPDAGRRGGVSS